MNMWISGATFCFCVLAACNNSASGGMDEGESAGTSGTTINGTTLFRLAGVHLAIGAGPDGNVWVSSNQNGNSVIVRVNPEGEMTQFSLKRTGVFSDNTILTGPDGNLWFTEDLKSKLARMTPEGELTEFDVGFDWRGMTVGPDDNLWLSNSHGTIARFNGTGIDSEAGEIAATGGPIAGGPDGNLWLRGPAAMQRITPSGMVTQFALTNLNSTQRTHGMTVGSDDNLWFTEFNANKIGRITPEGELTEFDIPSFNTHPWGITVGPADTIWFGQSTAGLGRITLTGEVTEFEVGVAVRGVALGADGNIWFTADNVIGRFQPPAI